MVRFGVAGYPPAFGNSKYRKDRLHILYWLRDLDLDALELQMTYGPRTTPERCRDFRDLAKELDIALSVHASYYIVFTSKDETKIHRSRETLKRTFELCDLLCAKEVVLHPGPLYSSDPLEVQERFVENLDNCLRDIGPSEIGLFVETAGKHGQLGSVQEILAICRMVDGVHPCIDFGHVHARTGGDLESAENVAALVDQLRVHLSEVRGARVHFHYTPIDFGPRGERAHKALGDLKETTAQLNLLDEVAESTPARPYFPRPEPVAVALGSLCRDFSVISEAHNRQEEGALALKSTFSMRRP